MRFRAALYARVSSINAGGMAHLAENVQIFLQQSVKNDGKCRK